MKILLLIAARNLRQAGSRTVLLGTAIAMVTALLVGMLSLSAGIRDNLIVSATTMSAGHVVVGGFYKTSPTDAIPIVTDAAEVRAIIEKETPDFDYVLQRQRGWAKLISASSASQSGLNGIDMAQERRFFDMLTLAKQSEYKEGGSEEVLGDLSRFANKDSAIIFVSQAKKLEVDVGDVFTIQTETQGGRTNTADVTVVAVAKDVGILSTFGIFVPTELDLELYQIGLDTTGAFWVYLHDVKNAESSMVVLRDKLAAAGYRIMDHQPVPFWMKFDTVGGEDWTGQKLDLTIWEDEVSFLMWILTAFDAITWFIVVILVSIVAIGIMNAMWNAVRERTREIGTMRAIGMTRQKVLTLFLLEAGLLGLGSTLIGGLVGSVVALAIDAAKVELPIQAMQTILLAETVHLVVPPMALVEAILALTALTALSALWPALRASRLSPIKALAQAE